MHHLGKNVKIILNVILIGPEQSHFSDSLEASDPL